MAQDTAAVINGKNILVTGGAGSIGGELVRHLIHNYNPECVRVLDINETALFDLEQANVEKSPKLRMLIGDIRDRQRLKRAMEDIDIVFNAAALKHVNLNEYTPSEAVKTNVLGTQNVLDIAIESDVGRVINISTDKAVNPTSVMGTTKLLAEKLTTAAMHLKGRRKTVFASVRFGNVLASRGSVVPLFLEQIKKGGPVTVTDPKMTRFFMSTQRAVKLILEATVMAKGGEVFILKMPSMRIIDLAEVMIEKFAPQYGYAPKGIKIKFVGARPGEKLHESLLTADEEAICSVADGIIQINPLSFPEGQALPPALVQKSGKECLASKHSGEQKLITKQEIGALLDDLYPPKKAKR